METNYQDRKNKLYLEQPNTDNYPNNPPNSSTCKLAINGHTIGYSSENKETSAACSNTYASHHHNVEHQKPDIGY